MIAQKTLKHLNFGPEEIMFNFRGKVDMADTNINDF